MKKLIFVFCLLLPLPVSGQGWLFQRSTTTYKTFSAGGAHPTVSHMSEVAVDHPRVAGKSGGLLVEGQSTNNFTYSQQQDHADWVHLRLASVTSNGMRSLDGNMGGDGIVANAVNDIHGIYQNSTLTATTYTWSVFAKAGDQDWLRLQNNTVGPIAIAYFDLVNCTAGSTAGGMLYSDVEAYPDGWCRCSMTFTGTAAVHTVIIISAVSDGVGAFAGDNVTVNTWLWQAQVEPTPFPTSPILTLASPVTRTADDITLDPHPDGINEIVLPELFSPTGPASKLTVCLETKCQFTDSTDIGENRHVFEISGDGGTASATRNRLFVQFGTDGRIYYYFRDDAVSDHYIYTAVNPVDLTEWHTHRVVIDFADYSRIDAWLDGDNSGMLYSGNAGSGSFDTTETEIRLGQTNSGVVNGHCRVRNFRITPSEIRAP